MSKLLQELEELEILLETEYNNHEDEKTMLLLINKEQSDNLKKMDKILFDVMTKNNNLLTVNSNLKYYNKIGQIIFAAYVLISSVYLFNIYLFNIASI